MDELTILFSNLKISAPTGPAVQRSTLKEPNALRRTPPEIRAIIFRFVLELEPLDFDVAVDTPASQVAALFAQTAAVAQALPTSPPVQPAQAPVAPGATLATAIRIDPDIPEEPQTSSLYGTPALLAALRATPDLYGEALDVFYAVNTFILDVTTFQSFSHLKPETAGLVKHLVIDLMSAEDVPKDTNRDLQLFFTYPFSNLRHVTRLQSLAIYGYSDDPVLYSIFVNGLANWINLRIITLITDKDWTSDATRMETQFLEFLRDWMKNVDHFRDWVCHNEELPQSVREIWPGKVTHWMAERETGFISAEPWWHQLDSQDVL